MTKLSLCACCNGQLEPAQQLRYLVETATLDNPMHLARIRMLPSVNGKPLPVCQACQAMVEANAVAPKPVAKPRAKPLASGLLGALSALSVGLLLGSLFTSRG